MVLHSLLFCVTACDNGVHIEVCVTQLSRYIASSDVVRWLNACVASKSTTLNMCTQNLLKGFVGFMNQKNPL